MTTKTTVQPGSTRWKELVTTGIVKESDRNWFLGDAALEIAPMGDDGVNNGTAANLALYAAETGVEYGSIRVYRDVAAAWPPPNRLGGASWKVHQMFMAEDHQQTLIDAAAELADGERITVTRAHELLGQSTAGRPSIRQAAKTAADVLALLTDPGVQIILRDHPELVGSLPRETVTALLASKGGDDEQERLIDDLRTQLMEKEEENAELLAKLDNPEGAVASDLDRAAARIETLESALAEATREKAALQAQGANQGRKWEENARRLESMTREIAELRTTAQHRKEELEQIKAADPDREAAGQQKRLYQKYLAMVMKADELIHNLDTQLGIDGGVVTGEYAKALVQVLDTTDMHMTAIRSKLGVEWIPEHG